MTFTWGWGGPDGVKVNVFFFFLLRIFFVTALALNPAQQDQQTKCTVITGCYITKSSISLRLSLEDGFK